MLQKKSLQKLPKVVQQIIADHPSLDFKMGKKFTFRPPNIIILGPPCNYYPLLTLHEIGHALSKHKNYSSYLKLLKLETEAWEKARPLAKKYRIAYDKSVIEAHLDTYRDFFYEKTTCPHCGNYCLESTNGKLFCPYCSSFSTQKPH